MGWLIVAGLLVGCAGREARPVMEHRAGDADLSCVEIESEMRFIDAEVQNLIPRTDKKSKNVGLGVGGLFALGIPWFFMDLSKAEQIEVEAYRNRYVVLEELYGSKGCADPESGTDGTSTEERLRNLESLREEGLVSPEEYATKRAKILEEI